MGPWPGVAGYANTGWYWRTYLGGISKPKWGEFFLFFFF